MKNLTSRLAVTVAQHSDAGRKPRNEDSIGIQVPEGTLLATKGIVVAIADGVSAAEAGREASETAIKGFINDYYSTPDSWSVKQSAHKVLIALNRWLYGLGQKYLQAEKGYVTTFSALILKSRAAWIFHVGDSRIYRLREGALEQLTRDHVARISADQCYLARALGIDINLEVDLRTTDLQPGDLFLLTTDGVHEHIESRHLRQMLLEGQHDLEALSQSLAAEALANGSTDNVSCQLVRVDALGEETEDELLRTLHQLPFPPELEVGMKLDGWRILRPLHASRRSQLYVVQHEATGQRAVMKTPSRNFMDDPAYIERFVMEEWVARRIDNPYVVKVIEPPSPRHFLYYLTEFIDGPTLADVIQRGPVMEVTAAVAIADKLMRGLRAFHRRETLHQDLKPDNVVMRGDDPVIIDFGSVHVAGVDEIATTFEREQALGTLDYSAPEYRLQRPRVPASDQFSLAMVLYELLTGTSPFGEAYAKALTAPDFLALKYVPAYRRNPLVPLWLDGALRRGLQVDADSRYESLSEFLHDLKHPNPSYLQADQRPWLEKDPVRFWKTLSGLLLLLNLFLLVWLALS